MTTLLIVVHVIVCLFLIVIVLLQHGKGADIGATFGGSSNTVFGTEGPLPLLNKITTAAAIIFMVTSLLLAQISGEKSIMSDVAAPKKAVEQPQSQQKLPTTIPLPGKTEGQEGSDPFPVESQK